MAAISSSRLFKPAVPAVMQAEEFVYIEVKERIFNGSLPPGTRLVHRSLARELGTSTIPVLMALRMLEGDGLVVNTPGLGATVRSWSREEVIDLYQIRKCQDGLAARLCAERAGHDELDAVVAANEEFMASGFAVDVGTNLRADAGFHQAIVRGAHCSDLGRLVENCAIIQCCMKTYCLSLNIPPIVGPKTTQVHIPIVEALLRRDAGAAESAARFHVEDSLKRHLELLERCQRMTAVTEGPHKWAGSRSRTRVGAAGSLGVGS